jgi:hypothetical protein
VSSNRRIRPRDSRPSRPFRSGTRDAALTNRAVIVWCDGVLGDPAARPFKDRDAKTLRRYARTVAHFGLGWQPGIADEDHARGR